MTESEAIAKLRPICLAHPGATETVTFGHPTFQVRKKTFCVLETYKGELSVCIKVGKRDQPLFLKDDRFYVTPYIGRHGWVSLRMNAAPLEWSELKELVGISYGEVAGRPSS
jgi:predicted DNA-binding protein (MmcQ/YjbR family)